MNNTPTFPSFARRSKISVQLQPHDLGAGAAELPRPPLPHPGEPVRSLRSGNPPDRHPDVQLQEPWRHHRGGNPAREVVGGWPVQHPQHEHRRARRRSDEPAGRTVAVAKIGTVRPNQFVRPARTVFNQVSSSCRAQQPSRVTREAARPRQGLAQKLPRFSRRGRFFRR